MTTQTDNPGLPEPSGPRVDRLVDPESRDAWSDDPQDHSTGPADAHGGEPPVDRRRKKAKPSGARAFFDWIVVVTVALLVAFVVRGFVLAHFVVDGSSMATTLSTNDRVFVNKLSYRLHDPNRGDVVVLHQITGATERDLIKRVIGLPGETIEVTSCVVRITGPNEASPRILNEPYLDPDVVTPTNCGGDFSAITVPEDSVFVMGDNRGGSQDSRSLGPISFDDLVGRAFVVFWPRDSWQWL